jgi:cobalamin biosynthesis Mg chelatase CobN
VFSNADGAYGANVNQLIEEGTWTGARVNPELAARLPDKGLRPTRQRKA